MSGYAIPLASTCVSMYVSGLLGLLDSVFVMPAKQKRDICIASPAAALSSSSAAV